MFLYEGSDHTGKTTAAIKIVDLVNRMIPMYDVVYQHMTRPTDRFNFGTQYLAKANPLAVQDRFHFGGVIYHTDKHFDHNLTHPNQHLTPAWLTTLDAVLALQGSFVVVFTADSALLKERLENEPKLEGEMFKIDQILEYNFKWHQFVSGKAPFFKPRFDVHWNATKDQPFPPDILLKEWAEAWVSRLVFCQSTGGKNVVSQIQFPVKGW